VDYTDPDTNGQIKLRKAVIGDVEIRENDYKCEIRGLAQHLQETIGQLISPSCRVDLDTPECGIPVNPPEWTPGIYVLNQYVKARTIPSGVFTAATITNPGAESGTTGWTNEINTLTTSTGSPPGPHTGSNYFSGTTASNMKAFQDLTIPAGFLTEIDTGNKNIRFRLAWFINALGLDEARMTIRYFDASSVQIGIEEKADRVNSLDLWVSKFLTSKIPALARTIRIAMDLFEVSPTVNNGFIDDITGDYIDTTLYQGSNFENRIYKVTTAGDSGTVQPTFDTTIGNTTADGTVVWTAEASWQRDAIVTKVTNRRLFETELLKPSTGGENGGFADDWFNGGLVIWQTGGNKNLTKDVKDFTADKPGNVVTVIPGDADADMKGPVLIQTGTIGSEAAQQTVEKQLGAGAIEFTPTASVDPSNSFVSYPDSSLLTIGTKAFNIEMWIRIKDLTDSFQTFASHYLNTGSERGWFIQRNAGDLELGLYLTGGSSLTSFTGAFSWAIDTWYHVAASRDSSNDIRLFVAGTQVGSTTNNGIDVHNSTEVFRLGKIRSSGFDDNPLDGFVDDFELRIGEAVRVANYTPPVVAHPILGQLQETKLFLPMPFDITVGDSLLVYAGCKKDVPACSVKFDNIVNMRSEPYVPGQDAIQERPNAQ